MMSFARENPGSRKHVVTRKDFLNTSRTPLCLYSLGRSSIIWAGTGGWRGCWWRWCCRRDGTLRTVQTALSRPIYILALHPASRGTALPSSRYLRLAPSLLASFFLALPLSRWSQTPLIIVIGPFLDSPTHCPLPPGPLSLLHCFLHPSCWLSPSWIFLSFFPFLDLFTSSYSNTL